jgi:XTP/dITP diphosphohydrolase
MREVIVATGNPHKYAEIAAALVGLPFGLRPMDAGPTPETGATLRDNAVAKAEWVFRQTGVWALGDDTGLEVRALGGAPGVHTARYAGEGATAEENRAKLLAELPLHANRTARFRCVVALCMAEGEILVTEGVCEGSIALEPAGSGGFGYDSLFIPAGFAQTYAELDPQVVARIGHRGRALAALAAQLAP